MGQAKGGKAPRAPRGRHDSPSRDLERGKPLSGPAICRRQPRLCDGAWESSRRFEKRWRLVLGLGVVNFAEVGRDPRVATISVSDTTISSTEFVVALQTRRKSRLVSAFFESIADA